MHSFTLIDLLHSKKILLLEEFDWIDSLNTLQINKLAEFFKAYSVATGTVILNEGEGNDFFFLLTSGQVAIMKEDNSGQQKELQVLGPGKLFGEMSFFDRGPCSATIVVKNDATLLVMDKPSFNALSTDVPKIALQITLSILSNVCKRLRHTTGKLIDLL